MEQEKPVGQTCQACGSDNYEFRSRQRIEAKPGKKEFETKYSCKKCGNEWKVRIPMTPE